ncbi:hypothetical protein DSECCO2_473870 [anaerobic digester metagenome]
MFTFFLDSKIEIRITMLVSRINNNSGRFNLAIVYEKYCAIKVVVLFYEFQLNQLMAVYEFICHLS